MKPLRIALSLQLLTVAALLSALPAMAETRPAGSPLPPQAASAPAPLVKETSDDLKVEIASIKGEVSVQKQSSGDFAQASKGMILRSGDTIKTSVGSCRLVIDGKNTIEVEPISVLKITAALRNTATQANTTSLELAYGKLKVDLPKLSKGSSFEVSTPSAVATVRGTVFYLKSGQAGSGPFSQLFVGESDGGVNFKNLLNGKSVLVPQNALSNAFGNGEIDDPKPLTPEQILAYIQAWQDPSSAASQQFGIEEIPLPGASQPPPAPDLFELPEDFGQDALIDKFAEQNIGGVNGIDPLLGSGVVGPSVAPKEEPDQNEEPREEPTEEEPTEEPGGISDEDRDVILDEVDDLLDDQRFDLIDAELARTADAHTGKVFSDVHGNRVRVDQYVIQPSASSVALLNLTYRPGEYQNGLSMMVFMTQFNRDITSSDGTLRELPWSDYMNIVERTDLSGGSVPGQYEQFIVHSGAETQPDLFPLMMSALFTSAVNATSDLNDFGFLMFTEGFSFPFFVNADQGGFWVQGLTEDSVSIFAGDGQYVVSAHNYQSNQHIVQTESEFLGVSYASTDGAQTTGFATHPGIADLDTVLGADFFRGNEDVHPAYFEEIYGGDRVLYGLFVPITDQGAVIDAPGFRVRGLRDLVSPSASVNGGQYNLETIFVYGSLSDGGFSETFRVDTVITPEIFSLYGLPGVDNDNDV